MKERKPPPVVRTDEGQTVSSRRHDRDGSNSAASANAQPKGPFTPAKVSQILMGVLKKGQAMPGEAAIKTLAGMLNETRAVVALARRHPPNDRKVRDAIEVLTHFFEMRRIEASAAASRRPGKVATKLLRGERQLREHFQSFVRAMARHDWSLDMDATVLMPSHESWHDSAGGIAAAFELAMMHVMPARLGLSSDGPIARFTAAAMPLVTGDHITAAAVAKHLQRKSRAQYGDGD